jgi:hypothetical protein
LDHLLQAESWRLPTEQVEACPGRHSLWETPQIAVKRLYSNKLAHRYAEEAAAAEAADTAGAPAGSREFNRLAIEEARLIYVVTEQEELIAAPDTGWPLGHAVLAKNRSVLAAEK